MIIAILDKAAGFYSVLFFAINAYMYAKINKKSFHLESDNWLYKYEKGWCDYFESVELVGDHEKEDDELKEYGHNNLAFNINIHNYHFYIRNHFYIYNEKTRKRIEEVRTQFQLENGKYDAIYIRHGDKLCSETKMIPSIDYLKLLLVKNPDCRKLFFQSDDYIAYLEIKEYIESNQLGIELVTLCDEKSRGIITHERYFKEIEQASIENKYSDNKEYLQKIKEDLNKTKPIENMEPDEIYEHTINLIVAVDIMIHSEYCVLDNQSNVSRFISVTHDDHMKLFDVRYPTENIDMGWTMCPAYW